MSYSERTATRSERRWWRGIVRRVERAFEGDQLAALRSLAAGQAPVYSVGLARPGSPGGPAGWLAGPVHLTAGDRRLLFGRVQAQVWASLAAAVAAGPVHLAGAGRYGRGWVLTFGGPQTRLTLLADRLRFLPAEGGAASDSGAPLELLAS
jgi:hypothetical protein